MSNIEIESNIDIQNECNYLTIESFKQAYKEKGLVPEEKDFPKDKRKMLERLKTFDARVDPSKPINKRIISMVRQPVSVIENGKRIVKDSLIFNAWIEGFNWADLPMAVEYNGGWFIKPNLVFSVKDNKHPFDPETGKKIGTYVNHGSIYEHTIFLSENQKERVKQLNDLIEQWSSTFVEEVNLQYRQPNSQNNHGSQRGGSFTWEQFCNLSLQQLGDIQGKGYYKDDKNTLRDRNGVMVEYNRSTGKVSAIQ